MTEDKEYIPTALAADIGGRFEPPLDGSEAKGRFQTFLKVLTTGAVESGAWAIGHVKAVVETDGAFMSLSSTTEDGNVRSKGELESTGDWSMTVNIIVYGPDADALESMFMEKASENLPGSRVEVFHGEGCDDPDCFDPFCRRPDHVHKDDCGCDRC